MNKSDIENIETDLLLDAIFKRYGYDFRNYARASVERRIRIILSQKGLESISQLIPAVINDESFFSEIVREFSITFTEMFRDPSVYVKLREQVIPVLKTYPFIKVWHAGCATGEESYSLAILFVEEGLYDRCTIYATDFNDNALEKAKEGLYKIDGLKKFTSNYLQAGGSTSLSNYYHSDYGSFIVDSGLKKNITFANHNLVTDGVFSEMNLIICRNVLIYFNGTLQNIVVKLFAESLIRGGFLCLGTKESLEFSESKKLFSVVDKDSRLYQRLPECPPGGSYAL